MRLEPFLSSTSSSRIFRFARTLMTEESSVTLTLWLILGMGAVAPTGQAGIPQFARIYISSKLRKPRSQLLKVLAGENSREQKVQCSLNWRRNLGLERLGNLLKGT